MGFCDSSIRCRHVKQTKGADHGIKGGVVKGQAFPVAFTKLSIRKIPPRLRNHCVRDIYTNSYCSPRCCLPSPIAGPASDIQYTRAACHASCVEQGANSSDCYRSCPGPIRCRFCCPTLQFLIIESSEPLSLLFCYSCTSVDSKCRSIGEKKAITIPPARHAPAERGSSHARTERSSKGNSPALACRAGASASTGVLRLAP